MQANILPLYTPLTHGWVKTFFLMVVMLQIKLMGKMCRHKVSTIFGLMLTPDVLGWVKRSDIVIVQISIID